jgi:hypothetical protein
MTTFTVEATSTILEPIGVFLPPSSPRPPSWPATGEGPWSPTATICGLLRLGRGGGSGAVRHRPTGLDRLWVLPHRPRRRRDRVQPGPVRAPPSGDPNQSRGLDRGELAAFLVAAERYDRSHATLAMPLGLNGLRVSEACSANSEALGFERGHRTLSSIIGKSSKPAMIPLVPRTARTVELAIGERRSGPILCRHDGTRLDRRTPIAGSVPSARVPGWIRFIPTCCGLPSSWRRSTPGCRCGKSSWQPVTPIRGLPPSMTTGARAWTATPPTWWWPS